MALTRLEYEGDGVRTVFPVDYALGYLRKEFVYVYQGDDYTDQVGYTWLSDTSIVLDTPTSTGTTIKIRRVVPRDYAVNDYESGAILSDDNLDDSFVQALMILEEISDGYFVDGAFLMNSDLDMQGFKITNLGDAVNDTDAMNLQRTKEVLGLNEVSGGSVISATAPAKDKSATRWWNSKTGKSYVLTENSTGYKQWVEERSPIDPPDYEVEVLYTEMGGLALNSDYHNKWIVATAPSTLFSVGLSQDSSGVYRQNTTIFLTATGETPAQLIAEEGVVLINSASLEFSATNSTVALMSISENTWIVVGDLAREV